MVTDGYQNIPEGRTDVESRLAREAGVEIFVVGVTSNINVTELYIIASEPKRNHVYLVQVRLTCLRPSGDFANTSIGFIG